VDIITLQESSSRCASQPQLEAWPGRGQEAQAATVSASELHVALAEGTDLATAGPSPPARPLPEGRQKTTPQQARETARLGSRAMNAARAARHGFATGRRGRALALAAATIAVGLVAPHPHASAATLSGVDLSTYVRVGRYDLPEPTRTAAPANSLLAQEASSVTYDWDTGSLFVVGDGGTSVVQVDKTGALIDSMTLAQGSSPQGTEFYDTEGIAYVGGGKLVLTEERDRQVNLLTYVPDTTLSRSDVKTVKLGTTIDNIGIEGITNDPQTGGFIAVKETQPEGVFQTGIDFAAGSATNGSPTTESSTNLFDPALAGLSDFSDVFALANLSTLTGPDTSHLLILSQESGKIVNIDRSGQVSSSLTIVGDADNPLSVPEQTHEGVTMDDAGNLYVVSEDGGGDIAHPQLWVYSPSSQPNQAPTAVTLTHQAGAITENTNTTSRLKVADVDVADDGLGTNNLTVTGPDASSFVVDATGLYLKAGTVLDYEAKTSYDVSVAVDDPGVGATPDATSAPLTLQVTDVADEGSSPASLIISEVSPWSSGDSPWGADWFEITNTGVNAVDLTGWKMDDNSSSFGNAVALNGVSSLAPGQSAVFLEGGPAVATAFTAAWFPGGAPHGFAVGTYSGSGVGLSTGGDAVNLFDSQGNRITGVSFGTSTSGFTFDNADGAGSSTLPLPAITTLSKAGRNGARLNAGETGSPGTIAQVPLITEVTPWGSGNSSYAADWFELTNTGTRAIDLKGFKMDDSSNAYANAVALSGVTSIAPGTSVILVEGNAATAAAFKAAWFGSSLPDVAVGSYSGSGVGLSTGGDAVNLFDAQGNRVTGVSFGASTTNFTFDNSEGLANTTISTLSTLGHNGAFKVGDELGSPGTIAPDTLAPKVAYSGNAGSYTVDQTVSITCAAADEARGSGIATTTCADVTGPADQLGLGTHAFSATATDNAGNVGTASGSYTVTVTAASLCKLTKQLVDGSAKYQRLSTREKAAADKLVDALCAAGLTPSKPTTKPLQKLLLVTVYKVELAVLSGQGWLTRAQATELSGFVAAL
jgi:uncharacterized protein YjiK